MACLWCANILARFIKLYCKTHKLKHIWTNNTFIPKYLISLKLFSNLSTLLRVCQCHSVTHLRDFPSLVPLKIKIKLFFSILIRVSYNTIMNRIQCVIYPWFYPIATSISYPISLIEDFVDVARGLIYCTLFLLNQLNNTFDIDSILDTISFIFLPWNYHLSSYISHTNYWYNTTNHTIKHYDSPLFRFSHWLCRSPLLTRYLRFENNLESNAFERYVTRVPLSPPLSKLDLQFSTKRNSTLWQL
jgi:hypothetical protein